MKLCPLFVSGCIYSKYMPQEAFIGWHKVRNKGKQNI